MTSGSARRTRIASAALAALAVLAAVVAGAAWAAWSAPTPVSGDTEIVGTGEYDAAIDNEGDSVFVWLDIGYQGGVGAIRMRTRSAAGVLGPLRIIATGAGGSLDSPEVAVDEDGDASVIWLQDLNDEGDDRLRARPVSNTGTVGTTQTISPPGFDAAEPEVAMTPTGLAVFAWRRQTFELGVQSRMRPISGTLTAVRSLPGPSEEEAVSPVIATNALGDIVFAWKSIVGSQGSRVRARVMPDGEPLGPVQVISPSIGAVNVDFPHIGLDDQGNAVFAWQRQDTERIYARQRSDGGELGAALLISPIDSHNPQIAVDEDNDSVIGWSFDNGADWVVRGRVLTRLGALGPVKTIGATPAGFYDLATDSAGNATFAWARDRAFVRVLSTETGVLGSQTALSPVGEEAGDPRLDVNRFGGATAAFTLPGPFPPDKQLNAVVGP